MFEKFYLPYYWTWKHISTLHPLFIFGDGGIHHRELLQCDFQAAAAAEVFVFGDAQGWWRFWCQGFVWLVPFFLASKTAVFLEVFIYPQTSGGMTGSRLRGHAKTGDLSVSESFGLKWVEIADPWRRTKSSPWEMPFGSVVLWNEKYIEGISYQWTFQISKVCSQNAPNYPPTHFFHPYTFGIFWVTKFQFDTYVSDGWLNQHATTTTTIRPQGVRWLSTFSTNNPTVSASPRSFHIEPYGNRSAKTCGVQRVSVYLHHSPKSLVHSPVGMQDL